MGGDRIPNREKGIMKYTKEAERRFFIYATIAMFVFYALLTIMVD